MCYREGLPLVLKGLDLEITGGQKVGIVGRTGAGKSTLLLCLLRLVEPCGGFIVIDGIDISTIGLDDLRSSISVIPQDPVLFTGTLRFNLDPFEKYSDAEVWTALERSHMKEHVDENEDKLNFIVEEGGKNFSAGQRQLLCLARALLRHSRILLLDEATSSVDPDTDRKIQETIRTEFNHSTILTIAHRIDTIMDYDRIIVLSDGLLLEEGPPKTLVANENSTFAEMYKAHVAGLSDL